MKQGKPIGNTSMLNTLQAVLFILMVALFLMLFISCGKKEEKVVKAVVRPVKTVIVKAGDKFTGLQLPGKVRATQRVNLAFKQVGGRLVRLPIAGREGERVKKGELLAQIDPKDFQVNLRNAEGQLNEAEAALKLAKAEYERLLRIREKDPGAVSGASIDRKREGVARSRGRLKSLKAAVDDAKNKLSYTYLRAPFSGVVAKRFVNNFQEVKPMEPIVSLQDISSVEILVDVPENVISIAKAKGKDSVKAVATFPTVPEKQFPLRFKELATDADTATQTYQVVLVMPQPEGINVLPGMTATVFVLTLDEEIHVRSMIVPAIAVVADPEGKSYVWVVDTDNMTVHKRDVSVGSVTGSENINILSGLKEGETIVAAGVLKLQEGMPVTLWDQQ